MNKLKLNVLVFVLLFCAFTVTGIVCFYHYTYAILLFGIVDVVVAITVARLQSEITTQ